MPSTLVGIYRYPVKGLAADALSRVDVAVGATLPLDRAWAIENGAAVFDPDTPRYLPKIHFLMLMRNERLAALETRFDEATTSLTILRAGKSVARGNLMTRPGRQIIEQFMAAFMSAELRGAPRIIYAPGHNFSDQRRKCVHIINLASVRDLERIMGQEIDPMRFRANLVIDGLDAWSEASWPGREITIGDARLNVTKPTARCAATNVDPKTGIRDLDVPAVLARKWLHTDFGVYAEVISPGQLSVGDHVSV